MTHKKDVLDRIFVPQLFSREENSDTDDTFEEYAKDIVKKPFEFYEQRFHPQSKQEILRELLNEIEETKEDQKKHVIECGLAYTFDDSFSKFVKEFLEMHPCSPKKTTIDNVFDLFVKMYYAYQRLLLYRKWRNGGI